MFWHFKKSTSIKQNPHVGNGVSAFGVLQIALMPGSRGVNYTIGAVRSSEPSVGRIRGAWFRGWKTNHPFVERTNYFTGRYKIAISRFQFIPYTYRIKVIHLSNQPNSWLQYIDSFHIEVHSQIYYYTQH